MVTVEHPTDGYVWINLTAGDKRKSVRVPLAMPIGEALKALGFTL